MATRKTYEKYEQINQMFDHLEAIVAMPKDNEHYRKAFFYVNPDHQQNYEALRIYYAESENNPLMDAACYIIAIPEIFNNINIFDYAVPLDFVFNGDALSDTFTNLDVQLQYLVAAVLEVSDVQIFKPSGYTMGMQNWNMTLMHVFWQYTAILKMQ
ncbi:DUF2538 family protein [Macrococcoides caseolyticum]|uniref:DUF2538 family protein n=1 Tax=Macrococcoides caseolyticum TaxID=69966 RepID=UPI001F2BD0FF|nr:DUF2538 family protein [Macrococcus caseolyticus]MCE4955691.1 DUF2538 family protein [Macrococcus caseolyticus]